MIHTNNRAINNEMQKWYQPTIGNNTITVGEGEDSYEKVDVRKNIDRAGIKGWQKVAKTPLYFNEKNKAIEQEVENKLTKVPAEGNYRVLNSYFSEENKAERYIAGLPKDWKGNIIFKDMSKLTIETPEVKSFFPKYNSPFGSSKSPL